MQESEFENIQKTLVSALGVRHHVSSLLDLAHEITLVSLNAKVTSAQIGEAGRVFSVMTSEITDISANLRQTVRDIRELTQKWTKIIAGASQQIRGLRSIEHSIAMAKKKNHQMPGLIASRERAMEQLRQYDGSYPRLLGELIGIIEAMEKSLKVVNYIKIGIMVESERLSGDASGERSPFQHLANEMQSAADKIRNIAQNTMQKLRELNRTPAATRK